jgi:aryl-alcohol dehydrogenase-like predicted oxidoreductase
MSNTLGRTNLQISKLGLGTVEIGLPYGIGTRDLPTDQEAETILQTAVEMGITYIDTARGYGVAEERIGKSGIGKMSGVVIGTKCGQFLEKGEEVSAADMEKRIREEVETSLRLLQLDVLPLVQFHGGSAEQIREGRMQEIMRKLQDEGKVQHVGIATRGEEAPLAALASGFFETIQTAYSILDQRMAAHVLPQAQEKNVGIINRSVLLKGALTPAASQLPEALEMLKQQSAKAAAIAQELGMDLPTLAIRFAVSHPAISTILLGTIKPRHLQSAAEAVAAGPLPQEILEKLYALGLTDPAQVDPSKWPPIA